MAYLTLRGINKIYPNGFHAVHDFNLEIEKGEFIVFVGSSGCGKSTTLRMIAGLENISKGDFLIDGEMKRDRASAASLWFFRAMPSIPICPYTTT